MKDSIVMSFIRGRGLVVLVVVGLVVYNKGNMQTTQEMITQLGLIAAGVVAAYSKIKELSKDV